MNDQNLILKKQTLIDIADAIRAKTGSSDKIKVKDLDEAVSAIAGSGDGGGEMDVYVPLEFYVVGNNITVDTSNVKLHLGDLPIYEQISNYDTGEVSEMALSNDTIDDTCLVLDGSWENYGVFNAFFYVGKGLEDGTWKNYYIRLNDFLNDDLIGENVEEPCIEVQVSKRNVNEEASVTNGNGVESSCVYSLSEDYWYLELQSHAGGMEISEEVWPLIVCPNSGNLVFKK
jgi:hypothetical protein